MNMCYQGIYVFSENVRECAYSLKWSGKKCKFPKLLMTREYMYSLNRSCGEYNFIKDVYKILFQILTLPKSRVHVLF